MTVEDEVIASRMGVGFVIFVSLGAIVVDLSSDKGTKEDMFVDGEVCGSPVTEP